MISLLMPAKVNCESAWENNTAGRSAQNGENRTATLDTFAGGELSASSISPRGHQCGMSMLKRNSQSQMDVELPLCALIGAD
jgi:hypothetical protein